MHTSCHLLAYLREANLAWPSIFGLECLTFGWNFAVTGVRGQLEWYRTSFGVHLHVDPPANHKGEKNETVIVVPTVVCGG